MLSTNEMRAVVYLKTQRCCSTGETITVKDPPELAGKFCRECVEDLARMLEDAHYAGERHAKNAGGCTCRP